MKKIQTVVEVDGEGLEAFLGERIILFCENYNYAGVIEGVNETFVKLQDGAIVYETGDFGNKTWKDAQKTGHPTYVMKAKIESFFAGK